MGNSKRPPPQRKASSSGLAAVRGHAAAIRHELSNYPTPAGGTDLRGLAELRSKQERMKKALDLLKEAEDKSVDPNIQRIARATRELIEIIGNFKE